MPHNIVVVDTQLVPSRNDDRRCSVEMLRALSYDTLRPRSYRVSTRSRLRVLAWIIKLRWIDSDVSLIWLCLVAQAVASPLQHIDQFLWKEVFLLQTDG